MTLFPWRRQGTGHRISAYVDGELDAPEAAELGEHLVFDPEIRRQVRLFERVDALTCAALAPAQVPDSDAFAENLIRDLSVSPEPPRRPECAEPLHKSRFGPVVLASIGILLTAGVTLAGLRRRGLV